MVKRTGLSRRDKGSTGFANVMQPESIRRLASYIYVDKALLLKLAQTNMDASRVDEIRALITLNQTPGYDISSPLDAYDALVMELASFIVDDNMELIQDELKKVERATIGIEEIPTEREIPVEVIELGAEITIPDTYDVKRGSVTYRRAKSVKWRERGQSGLSAQEQFLYSRHEQPIKQVQQEYVSKFKIYRSMSAIRTERIRVAKRVERQNEVRSQKGI